MVPESSDADDSSAKPSVLSKIPTSKLSRGLKLAGLTANVGMGSIGAKLSGLFSNAAEKQVKNLEFQIEQAKKIASTLGQMKGAAMKLGQLLSIHAEHLFPKEVSQILAKLQGQVDYLDFKKIDQILRAELKDSYGKTVTDIDPTPIGSASIGQVHRARVDGQSVVLKVQYPGVAESIDSDVENLASILSVLSKVPQMADFNLVIDEIKAVLKQETDYKLEATNQEFFRNYFKSAGDVSAFVPKAYSELSSSKILVSEECSGISVQEFAQSTASQAARDFLGTQFLRVFYHELFLLGKVQTDPNFGNYKVRWSFGMQEPELALLDFGAVREFSRDFRRLYVESMRAGLRRDGERLRQCAVELGFLYPDDTPEQVALHNELVYLCLEPFTENKSFDWASSNLDVRNRQMLPKLISGFRLRPPPREFVFLNRKVIGVFFFCSSIRAKFNPRPILDDFMDRSDRQN